MLQMEDSESIQKYFTRVVIIVNQVRGLRHKLYEAEVLSKVLRCLARNFDYVAVALESRDLSKLTLDELSGYLQAHEIRVNRSERFNEKALNLTLESATLNIKERKFQFI